MASSQTHTEMTHKTKAKQTRKNICQFCKIEVMYQCTKVKLMQNSFFFFFPLKILFIIFSSFSNVELDQWGRTCNGQPRWLRCLIFKNRHEELNLLLLYAIIRHNFLVNMQSCGGYISSNSRHLTMVHVGIGHQADFVSGENRRIQKTTAWLSKPDSPSGEVFFSPSR